MGRIEHRVAGVDTERAWAVEFRRPTRRTFAIAAYIGATQTQNRVDAHRRILIC